MDAMMNYTYILVMALSTLAVRTLPFLLMKKPIENRFVKSFLYYVPYVTLAVMTFPAIITVTGSPVSGIAAMITGITLAWTGRSLICVAASCCGVAIAVELLKLAAGF